MKSVFHKAVLFFCLYFVSKVCVTDEVAAPKLICTQPDLHQIKRLAMCMRLQMHCIKYDDVIEAMLFLAMKPEIFQIDLLSNFGDSHNTSYRI
jgi:hypothetical protein